MTQITFNYCIACDDYGCCSGEPCPDHPLIMGIVKEMMENEMIWGDMLLEADEMRLASRSKDEITADKKKAAAQRRKEITGLREYIVSKSKKRNCDVVGGKCVLKHKMRGPCENISLPDEILADGSSYEGGCWAHNEGACPFMHPGEEKLFTFTDGRPVKLVNGKQPAHAANTQMQANVMYYSTRVAKPSPLIKSSGMVDSW
jgi:hypothetical protein